MSAPPTHLKLPRSPEWPALRNQWLKDHPTCAACGSTKKLEVHHKVPVHVSRSQELDASNLITLCEHPGNANTGPEAHCHFIIGHLGNWFNFNRQVDKQASDHLLARYPHALAVIKHAPVEVTGVNPAAGPTPSATEVSPEPFKARRRRTG